jgi:hypothetical protein
VEDLKSLPQLIIDALGALPLEASADVRASVVAEVLGARFKAVSHVGEFRTFLREVGVPKSTARKLAPSFKEVAGEAPVSDEGMVSISTMLHALQAVAEDLQTDHKG